MKEDKPSKLRITIDRIKKAAFEAGFLAGWKAGLRDHSAEMREEAYLKFDAAETAKRLADHFAITDSVK